MNAETTLITGASSGIGLHLAHEFASHGHPLVLVAPVESELRQVALDLQNKHGVEVQTLAKDLRDPDAAQEIFEESKGTQILVNNAGHGQKGKFWEYSVEQDISMIRLNIEAVVKLTKLFLQPMIRQGRGRILNVASVAGFEPGPNLAVYHATKAFVLSFGEALATELEDTAITVTSLCPGPTDTDFFEKAEMTQVRGFQQGYVMAPQDVAAAGYKALMNEDRIVVPGAPNKALVFSRRFLSKPAQAKLHEKLYQDVPPKERKRKRGDIERKAARKH